MATLKPEFKYIILNNPIGNTFKNQLQKVLSKIQNQYMYFLKRSLKGYNTNAVSHHQFPNSLNEQLFLT